MSIKLLIETELAKAEGVLAAKDLVDRVQKALEDVNSMRVKDLPDLGERLGTAFDSSVVQNFITTVNQAMEELGSNLENARNTLDQASKTLTGEESAEPMSDMGGTDDLGDLNSSDDDTEDEFDSFNMTPAAGGGDEPEGRAQRESVDARKARLLNKMVQIHESMKKLNKK